MPLSSDIGTDLNLRKIREFHVKILVTGSTGRVGFRSHQATDHAGARRFVPWCAQRAAAKKLPKLAEPAMGDLLESCRSAEGNGGALISFTC